MAIKLSARSRSNMDGVHPDLVRVIERAALIAGPKQDFIVLEGVRSREKMAQNYGKGRTAEECKAKGVDPSCAQPGIPKVTWLKDPFASNHGVKSDGYGHAADIMPFPIDWSDTNRIKALVELMKSAAHQEGVNLICGADWKESRDADHFEVP